MFVLTNNWSCYISRKTDPENEDLLFHWYLKSTANHTRSANFPSSSLSFFLRQLTAMKNIACSPYTPTFLSPSHHRDRGGQRKGEPGAPSCKKPRKKSTGTDKKPRRRSHESEKSGRHLAPRWKKKNRRCRTEADCVEGLSRPCRRGGTVRSRDATPTRVFASEGEPSAFLLFRVRDGKRERDGWHRDDWCQLVIGL